MRRFAGHSGPNLVFFGAVGTVESVVRKQKKQPHHPQQNPGVGAQLGQRRRLVLVDVLVQTRLRLKLNGRGIGGHQGLPLGGIGGGGLVPKHVARINNPARVVEQEQGNGLVLFNNSRGKGQVHIQRGLFHLLHGHSPTSHLSGLAMA